MIKYLTKEETDQLLNSIDNQRDYVMFKLMYLYGLRREELRRLKVDSLLLKENIIKIEAVKNGVSGMYVLMPSISKLLNDYVYEYELGVDSPLFRSRKGGHLSTTQIYRIFRRYSDRLNIKKELCHPHVLRHSIAVHLADNGRTAEEVQMHLRHKSITSTMKYYQITNARRKKLQTEMLQSII